MATYEQLLKANQSISTRDIKGKDYAEVNQRVKAFRMVYPDGAIVTEIVSNENGVVVMKATATDSEGKILSTGFAYEKESSSYINKTSYIENCETSAVGRCLGFAGLGIETSICSAEELENAINRQTESEINKRVKEEQKKAVKPKIKRSEAREDFEESAMRLATDRGIKLDDLLKQKGKSSIEELTDKELNSFITWLEKQPIKEG